MLDLIQTLDEFYSHLPAGHWLTSPVGAKVRAARVEAVALLALDAYAVTGRELPPELLALVEHPAKYEATLRAATRHKAREGR